MAEALAPLSRRKRATRLRIRAAVEADREGIARLWSACGLAVPFSPDAWRTAMSVEGDNATLLLAETEFRRIVGSALIGQDGYRGWLYYVAVHPRWQKAGLGKRMVREAEDWLRQAGVKRVMLLIRESNREVAGFYEKQGYAELPRVVLTKPLDSFDDLLEDLDQDAADAEGYRPVASLLDSLPEAEDDTEDQR